MSEFQEVKIPVPWGHVAGKWWGPMKGRPILCIHGWQDNAATFDTLIPHLPQHLGYLAIDIPGHGFSSRYPDGVVYTNFDFVVLIKYICHLYRWDKISILSHSMGGVLSFLLAGLCSDEIDMIIGIDGFSPTTRSTAKQVEKWGRDIDGFINYDEINQLPTEPPIYTFEEAAEKLHHATQKSVNRDSARILLTRGLEKSKTQPEKYFYIRDHRLKINFQSMLAEDAFSEYISHIKCPYLLVRYTDSPYYRGQRELIIKEFERIHSKFEYRVIDGEHHMHLNRPERMSCILSEFINKYRPQSINSKL